MSYYDDTFDGTSEAVAMGQMMLPPEGFLEEAVARGLAVVAAEEALMAVQESRSAANDGPRHKSGVIDLRPPASSAPDTLRR